ncbi:hypothetical protein PLESTF_001940900, partial [Pleodorina starrii]
IVIPTAGVHHIRTRGLVATAGGTGRGSRGGGSWCLGVGRRGGIGGRGRGLRRLMRGRTRSGGGGGGEGGSRAGGVGGGCVAAAGGRFWGAGSSGAEAAKRGDRGPGPGREGGRVRPGALLPCATVAAEEL